MGTDDFPNKEKPLDSPARDGAPAREGSSAATPAPTKAGPSRFPDARWIAGLFLLALAARITAALQTRVIAPDGVEYVRIAKAFASGDFAGALSHPYHPAYPFLVSGMHALAGDWTAAASTVSVIFGSLALIPLYFLLRPLVGRTPALFAAAVYAFLPPFVRFGADGISEATFHFFLLSAFALAYPRVTGVRGLLLAALGGAAGAFAYMTRPEGVGIWLSVLAWGILHTLKRRGESKKILMALGVFTVAFACVSTPYALHIRAEMGHFSITKKKPLGHLLQTYKGEHTAGAEPTGNTDLPTTSTLPGAAWRAFRALAAALFYFPLALAILGLIRFEGRDLLPEAYLAIPVFLWLVVAAFLARSHGYVSHRHTSPAALMLLGYVGLGAVALAGRGALLFKGKADEKRLNRLRRRLTVFLALVLIVSGSTTAFRIYRAGKVHVIEIGRDLEKMEGPGKVIVGNRIRIAYYAGGRHHDIPPFEGLIGLGRHILEVQADLFVIDVLDPHFPLRHADLLSHFEKSGKSPPGMVFLRRWEIGEETGRARDIRAYRIDREALVRWVLARE